MSTENQKLAGLPTGGWNHVVVKGNLGIETDIFQIREQYGNWGIGQTARTPYGDSLEDLEFCLESMLKAVKRAKEHGYINEEKPVEKESYDEFDGLGELGYLRRELDMIETASCTSCDDEDEECNANNYTSKDKLEDIASVKDAIERIELDDKSKEVD